MRLQLDRIAGDENGVRRTPTAATTTTAPTQQLEATPRQTAAVGNAGPRVRGARIRMLWGDEWFTGTCGANRRDGAVWATRVCFDAAGEWPATASWHVLAEEEYETLAGVEPTRKRRRA